LLEILHLEKISRGAEFTGPENVGPRARCIDT